MARGEEMKCSNIWNHFKTITEHKLLVMGGCFKVGLFKQGLLHDLSKYSPEEFWIGVHFFQGTRSPNAAEREKYGFSKAWLHHKGRNKHHFEYWVDYAPQADTVIAGAPMPRRYVAEMVMDRISACRNYSGDTYTDAAPLEYFLKNKDRIWFIHKTTKRELEGLLRMLAEKGEQKTFAYIRRVYLPEGRNKRRRRKKW